MAEKAMKNDIAKLPTILLQTFFKDHSQFQSYCQRYLSSRFLQFLEELLSIDGISLIGIGVAASCLSLLEQNDAKNLKRWLKGTWVLDHLRVLSEGYPMSTNMTGFRWISKIFASRTLVLWIK